MTIEDEDEWIGVESHLVPKADPGGDCNAKKVVKIVGTDIESEDLDPEVEKGIVRHNNLSDIRENEERIYFRGYCNNPAGHKTDHKGEGRCKYHDAPGGDRKNNGAPKHNQNAAKHAISADPHHYHENLDPEQQSWIEDMTHVILDRIRRNHGREPDPLDKVLARRVVIKLDMVAHASDYSARDLLQVIIDPQGGSHEEPAALVEMIRRYDNSIFSNLKQLGVLEDPESQKADAVSEWRDFLSQGQAVGEQT